MPFTPEQDQAIGKALGEKVKSPCPSCGQFRRSYLPDLVLFPLYAGPPPAVLRLFNTIAERKKATNVGEMMQNLGQRSQPHSVPYKPTATAVPSIVVVCGNCGFMEFYNVHALGVANALGIFSSVVPHGG